MTTNDFVNDLPLDLCRAAYHGTSFTPEKRAESTRNDYAATMAADYAQLVRVVQNKPDLAALMESEFARYRSGYQERYSAKLRSDSRCMSWMITGPSNFPVRRMEKRNNVAHKRLEELLDYRKRAMNSILKKLCPELRPIMAGDSDATERLRKEIEAAEKLQKAMTLCNATLRKHLKEGREAQFAALVAVGFTESQAGKLLQTDCFGGIGFPGYRITNNGANIRRMKQRLERIQVDKILPDTVKTSESGIRFEDCPPDNRVRLFYPGKPEADVRERLKSCGFRWTPSLGCWQAYRNYRTIDTAKRVMEAATA